MVFKGRFFSSKKSDTSSSDGSSNCPRSTVSNSSSPIGSDKKKPKSSFKDKSTVAITRTSTPTSSSKNEKKDSKYKEAQNLSRSSSGILGSSSSSKLNKSEEAAASPKSASVSPLVASSLGLNKIKTRSGPLLQESFLSFGSRDKGASLGSSNLSKPLGGSGDIGGGVDGGLSLGSGKEVKLLVENADSRNHSDNTSMESGPSRDQSPHVVQAQVRSRLQNGESSSETAGRFNASCGHSGGVRSSDACTPEIKASYDCENPKESESPRFQAILRVTSAPRKRLPGDIKSFSHELNSKGVRPYPFWKPRRLNNLEEVLTMIRTKFDKAKEEVDSDLHIFAADLVGILEKNVESHPEWQETLEDLLVLARSCAMTSPGEFWLQCEGIVQDLDDKRQELPMGMLKQLHTRMLFILTRCTRLLQFHKESAFTEDDHVFQLRQSLQPADKHVSQVVEKDKNIPSASKATKTPSARKYYSQEQHGLEWKRDYAAKGNFQPSPAGTANEVDSTASGNQMASWKQFSSSSRKSPKDAASSKEQNDKIMEASKLLNSRRGNHDAVLATANANVNVTELPPAKDSTGQSAMPSKHQHKVSWGYWGDQPGIADESSIICRICEEQVPTLHVEDHSRICAIADRCDQKGLSVNERLLRIAGTLEKLMDSFSQKDFQHAVGSPDVVKVSNSSVTEESDLLSPKLSDWSRRGSEDTLDCFPETDNFLFMDELKGLPSMLSKTRFGPKSDQGMTTSSAGSMTPRSPLMTPTMSQIDLLLSGKGSFSEHGDLPQVGQVCGLSVPRVASTTRDLKRRIFCFMCKALTDVIHLPKFPFYFLLTDGSYIYRTMKYEMGGYLYVSKSAHLMNELADIARCVANAPLDDDRSLSYLLSCLEDLKVVTDRRKFDALTVETFGARIEKLIREKYLQLCELVDDVKVDISSTVIDEDAPLDDDVVRSLRTSPLHSTKDRTSIDDFEIIKPISRGAFGRVFLAKKRTTGDLFAIKVLKKADMIRKNAVESILAERNILISVRNPFVVRFFYSFTCRENLYLVMEYLNGGDLYSLLRNLGCLDEDVARVYIAEVVLALEYLHSLRVVHRDLKPDNLLIAHDGHVKLTDFGLSKVGLINSTDDLSGPAVCGTSLMEDDEPQLSVSDHQQERRKKRSAVGTPDYLAPEILLGTGHGFTADWWSVGVILFELIVGIPPFNAEHPQVPEEMSPEAHDLIDQLLTEDPNERLGARGASELKQHPFFRDINWYTLARQKAAFVPASESVLDTSYFTSRFSWNPSDEQVYAASEFEDSSDNGSMSDISSCLSNRHDELGDECGGLAEFNSGSDINYSFSNFSFKNLSQLASINYDLLTKGLKDDPPTNSSA
ncbi:probable serine/threonine protein kinase IREH1 isoform X2 [Olea europaea var. sylvestris]|uniref:probable serine/threonine protein kinase IREH1 isoform X2 n=1 Tax=Olea europaea var. sylvestris TaxID=158386 RepID=UPI000C1D382E|nr:probable serine/threonine protein kinase IREH1 isoform X2 [Olea europaea var. sylvestris]